MVKRGKLSAQDTTDHQGAEPSMESEIYHFQGTQEPLQNANVPETRQAVHSSENKQNTMKLSHPFTGTNTSFFFRSKPTSLVSNVKRILREEEIEEQDSKTKAQPSTKPSQQLHDLTVESREKRQRISQDPSAPSKINPITIDLTEASRTNPEILPTPTRQELDDIDPLLKQRTLISATTSTTAKPVHLDVPEQPIAITLLDQFVVPMKRAPRKRNYILSCNEPFSKLYTSHYHSRRVDPHTLVFLFNNMRIYPSATPASLGIMSGSMTIMAYERGDFERQERERKSAREQLLRSIAEEIPSATQPSIELPLALIGKPRTSMQNLRIKTDRQSEPLELQFSLSSKIADLLEHLRSLGHIETGTKCKLVFDGQVLQPEQTLVEAGIEDEDLLELWR